MAKKVYIRKKKLDESALNEYGSADIPEQMLRKQQAILETLHDMHDEMKKQTAIQQRLLQAFTVFARKELAAAQKEIDAEIKAKMDAAKKEFNDKFKFSQANDDGFITGAQNKNKKSDEKSLGDF